MKIRLVIFLFFVATTFAHARDSLFGNYEMIEFDFKGHDAKIVIPNEPDSNGYWIWRARFWGHEPQLDIQLLERGFHVAFVDVGGMFGSPEAVALWSEFYEFVTQKYNLNTRVVLEGMSRGGLIVYNWASQNTDKVFCIYADAPVCDIKSWPGGLFKGQGSPADWQQCLAAYNLNQESVLTFEGNPVSTCVHVARAHIPVIHVCGDSDKVVPYKENTEILADKFREAGGTIEIILKPGVGHHPHSLEDPKPIVDFILNSIQKRESGILD